MNLENLNVHCLFGIEKLLKKNQNRKDNLVHKIGTTKKYEVSIETRNFDYHDFKKRVMEILRCIRFPLYLH